MKGFLDVADGFSFMINYGVIFWVGAFILFLITSLIIKQNKKKNPNNLAVGVGDKLINKDVVSQKSNNIDQMENF